jgi:U3 small nucleolar RNA-associated protein 19
MDSSLKSSHLPAYLAAAFAKKLARLSLSAPPAGCLLVIAMVHNLLRRHPAINCLVHRDTRNTNTSGRETNTIKVVDGRLGRDPFLASEPDTAKCNALESSLWEIETLRSHYCPAVSRFVVSLETDLTVRRKTTEVAVSDFSSGSYSTIFAEEVNSLFFLFMCCLHCGCCVPFI